MDEGGGQRSLREQDFHKEVEATRSMLSNPVPLQQDDNFHVQIEESIQQLEDSIFQTDQRPSTHQRVLLLEVYANPHSPLTETV